MPSDAELKYVKTYRLEKQIREAEKQRETIPDTIWLPGKTLHRWDEEFWHRMGRGPDNAKTLANFYRRVRQAKKQRNRAWTLAHAYGMGAKKFTRLFLDDFQSKRHSDYQDAMTYALFRLDSGVTYKEPTMFDPNKPVQTRDGKPARIVCTDGKNPSRPLVALITYTGLAGNVTVESAGFYNRNGRVCENIENDDDLVNIPEEVTVERWGVIRGNEFISTFPTETEARAAALRWSTLGENFIVKLTGKYTR
jgi:hypothetical protein